MSLVSLSDRTSEMFTFKLYWAPDAVMLACCTQESKRKRNDEAIEREQCMSVGDEVIATMKHLWPNGFVCHTLPHDVQRLKQGWWRFVHWKTTMPDVLSRCGVHKRLITGHKCWLGHRGHLEADLFVAGVVETRPINRGGTLCVLARGRVLDHRWIMVVYICAVAPAWWCTCEWTRI